MIMVRGSTSRLIFLDSRVNTHGDRTKILVPSHPFSAVGQERIALTLLQFSMRRTWYNVNPTNNTGYVEVDGTLHEFQIKPGVYHTFAAREAGSLTDALNVALAEAVATTDRVQSIEAVHDATSRLFTVIVTPQAGDRPVVKLKLFAIKTGVLPTGVSLNGGFNDVHQILGGIPSRSSSETVDSFTSDTGDGGQTILTGYYPASLNTLDAIYIHLTALETGNFMSTGHDVRVKDDVRLVESSLYARIPFARSSFDEVHEVITYTDAGGDQFQAFPLRKNLEQLELRVTDSSGRSLAQLDPTQGDNGLMAWQAVLRFDLFKPPPRPGPVVGIKTDHPPTL